MTRISVGYGVRTNDLGINDNLIQAGEVIAKGAKNGKRPK